MNCQACGAALSPKARFCHKCGAQTGASPTGGWRASLPWGVAGVALGALVAVLALRGSGGPQSDQGGAAAPFAGAPAGDISRMSPEEMAKRLFDRVMRLAEETKQDSVEFFVPMALQTYAQLPALDLDARYDIGLLHLAVRNAAGALAQADTILRVLPTHLYGFVLRGRALELGNDARGARQAYASFLRYEAAERATQRPEYAEHSQTLDAFHAEAVRGTGGATR